MGYGATVENADGAVIPSSGAVTAAGGCTVRIPAAALPPDDYVVNLRGVKNGGTLEDLESYYFGVPR